MVLFMVCYMRLARAEIDLQTGNECIDQHENCPFWAETGECTKNRVGCEPKLGICVLLSSARGRLMSGNFPIANCSLRNFSLSLYSCDYRAGWVKIAESRATNARW
jgi:hypothetical protein